MFEQILLIVDLILIISLFIFVIKLKNDRPLSIKVLIYSAFCICISFILSYIRIFELPQGGSISPGSMFFITIIGYWFGIKAGILGGIAFSLLKLITSPFIIHPIQLLLDYPLSFGALGLSGLFRKGKYSLYIGYIVACLGRLFFTTLSGVVFFSTYALDTNPILFSAVYNISYMLPEMILTIIIISTPTFRNAIKTVKVNI